MSRIYIAAPWIERKKIPTISAEVEAIGHVIPHKWWEVENAQEGFESSKSSLREQAFKDLNGVKSAQIILLINAAMSEGKSVEQGLALADSKPILAVGKLGELSKNVFHYLPFYHWVDTVEDALKVLQTISWLTEDKK